MELDLSPKSAEALFEGEGGTYYIWSTSHVPLLAKTNVAAGRLLLRPLGFALPHFADADKVGYVVQGTDGLVGMVLPNFEKEVVLKIKQGDVIPVPTGSISWWFNNGDSDITITFLGDTSNAHIPGQLTYSFLTGALGIIKGFSTELLSKSYNLNQCEVNKLTKSQTGALIIKLEKGQFTVNPQLDHTKELVYDIDVVRPNISVTNAGLVTSLTQKEFPFIGEVGLSMIRVKLEPNAIKAPSYLTNPVVQLIYIARGGGKIEIVDFNGQRVLDTQVKAGQLLILPRFFVIAEIAGEEGMETYSILTTKTPSFEELAGRESIWRTISPTVQQVALNVDSEFQKLFVSKVKDTTNLIAPTI